jgi:hypothetical protein
MHKVQNRDVPLTHVHTGVTYMYYAPVGRYWVGQVKSRAFANLCVYTGWNDIEVHAIHKGTLRHAINPAASTAAGNRGYVIMWEVIQELMCSHDWSSVSQRREVYRLRQGLRRTVSAPANEDTTSAAAEREQCRWSRDTAQELVLLQPRIVGVLHGDQ